MQQQLQLKREELDAAAECYFKYICGLHSQEASRRHLRKSAYAARDSIAGRLNLRAATRSFGPEVIGANGLLIEGHAFPCRALAQQGKQGVLAVYAFVLTAGELYDEKPALPDALYGDLWGTAYINAAGFALRKRLGGNHEQPVYISDAIAPGYYDMGAEKIVDILHIIDGTEIGVVLQGMTMTPLKSCAGFYVAVENKKQVSFLDDRCSYCHKESGGCAFCAYQNAAAGAENI